MKNPKASLQLCLGICAYDGYLSESELDYLFKVFHEREKIDREMFDYQVDVFFDASLTLEELYSNASPLEDELLIAEIAASSDGLDLQENLALQKCYFLATKDFQKADSNA